MNGLLMHPATAEVIRGECQSGRPEDFPGIRIFGMSLYEDAAIPEFKEKWKPPKSSRFVDFDERDEAWMRPLGIGVYRERVVYHVNLPRMSMMMTGLFA